MNKSWATNRAMCVFFKIRLLYRVGAEIVFFFVVPAMM